MRIERLLSDAVDAAVADDGFAAKVAAIARAQIALVDALAAADRGDVRCVESRRLADQIEGVFRLPYVVPVREMGPRGAAARSTPVPIDVRIVFHTPDIASVLEARVGARDLPWDAVGRIFPAVAGWSPRAPRFWRALAMLCALPPPGVCGVCLEATCGCPGPTTSR